MQRVASVIRGASHSVVACAQMTSVSANRVTPMWPILAISSPMTLSLVLAGGRDFLQVSRYVSFVKQVSAQKWMSLYLDEDAIG